MAASNAAIAEYHEAWPVHNVAHLSEQDHLAHLSERDCRYFYRARVIFCMDTSPFGIKQLTIIKR